MLSPLETQLCNISGHSRRLSSFMTIPSVILANVSIHLEHVSCYLPVFIDTCLPTVGAVAAAPTGGRRAGSRDDDENHITAPLSRVTRI